ncbi:OmpA family protein [Candidatus Dependentiae bacterium]|nr:OmpA family protein [Candidatus Dependentiae bacterium]MCC7414760.1 OmpA family protein [Campylobacterota bacterium]
MNKQYPLLLLVLVGLAGCSKKKSNTLKRNQKNKTELFSEVEIPLAEEVLHKILDQDEIREFKMIDDLSDDEQSIAATFDAINDTWIEDMTQADSFKAVLFDFDKSTPRADQEKTIKEDIKVAKRILDEAKLLGGNGKRLKVSGHACHSAGSGSYNLGLSEKRAKSLADMFVAAGISREDIKIVGYGMEVPALVNGKPVDGNREQQAPNRRDEITVIYS